MYFAGVEYVVNGRVLLYVAVCCSESNPTYIHCCWYGHVYFAGVEYVISCSVLLYVAVCCNELSRMCIRYCCYHIIPLI